MEVNRQLHSLAALSPVLAAELKSIYVFIGAWGGVVVKALRY